MSPAELREYRFWKCIGFLAALIPGSQPITYNDAGHALTAPPPQRSIYDAVG